ncbi:hypothetical protein [Bacillus massiliglaciei]|uniref:hypothetical protein n=1 Tax=Bacillus massiliglaciei TaxID=1816693 RepID=UPI000DA61181|nr:hypothetical protein [Bacillus massiliglaciei]
MNIGNKNRGQEFDGPIDNLDLLWSVNDTERFGKEGKTLSQYGIYEKHSSYFGINVKNLEMNNINYADTRKTMDMLTSKLVCEKLRLHHKVH